MSSNYDLTVIGGGPGGYVAAIRACQYGLKVAVVEEREIGGTCLNRGCIPTKSLLHSAEIYNLANTSFEYGIDISDVSYKYSNIMARKDAVINQLRLGVEFLLKSRGCDIIKGRAFIKDRNTIVVSGKDDSIINTDKIIIATGSRPFKPSIEGIDGLRVFDSDRVLECNECPERVVIIGGGVIGVEFATIFNSLGKEVTIIEMLDKIIAGLDEEISLMLRKTLETKGVKIFTGARVISINSRDSVECTFEKEQKRYTSEGDIAIVAIGRKPNTENIGLENVGVATERGFIKVDDNMETSVEGIYAVGDVIGKDLLAHVASAQGLIAAANVAGRNRIFNYTAVPKCIYTSPEIAAVGLTETEAINKGYNVRIGKFPVSANGKAMIMGAKEGVTKIISDKNTGEILGAHIMAPRATELISEMCLAMNLESTIEEVAGTIHPHPTISEIIMEASHDIDKLSVHKPGR